MPKLTWTLDRRFSDHAHGFVAEGPGTYEVPEELVDEYLDHRSGGWERPTESDVDSEGSEDVSANAFDAAAFIDRSWQSVTSDIEDGAVDEHLDAVEAAEENRDSPRDSVLSSISDRR
ncbi:hypothetical protein C2R22_05950 [Salinigranum rubrum]|uniref:Uncharacterized protein n=2 Tax=Salinigranum rubrum TaxID=755307 RepID=A0A2I8VH61_9EURY|nr:hypothetical protein C2R22_05950 [Salinigranum rubrum]